MLSVGDNDYVLLFSAMVALLGFLTTIFLFGHFAERRYKRRLKSIYHRSAEAGASASVNPLARLEIATPKFDRVVRRWLPRRDILVARLERTGRQISIGQYLSATVTIALMGALAVLCFTPLGITSAALIGMLLGAWIPHAVVSRMGNRRVAAFVALFPDAIDLMVRSLRSGLPISEALVSAGQELADPVGCEFRMIESGMRLGRDLDTLLWEIAKRIDTPEYRFFIIAMGVQRETGGNLAETLSNLSESLRKRRQMRAKVRAMASETRATTMILGGLPVIVIGILTLTAPDYLKPLFHDVRGYFLDGIAIAMLAVGVTIMNRMARFEI